MNLVPGQQQANFPVLAKEFWNDTGIDMVPWEQYMLTAMGLRWDSYIPSSLNGFFLPGMLVNRFLRHRFSNSFASGNSGNDRDAEFTLGTGSGPSP